MIALALGRFGRLAIFASCLLAASAASAQQLTAIKFSLDFKFEGPSAPFVVAIDKGYFKAEGLDVTIDTAAGSLEPINRVASGTYDMGFGDINSLIKFRDANPGTPIKAIFIARAAASRRRRIWKARSSARRLRTAPTRSGRSSCRRTISTPRRSRS